MKLSITKFDLVKALTLSLKVMPKRPLQPVLGYVLLDCQSFVGDIVLTSTDLDDTLSLNVPMLSAEEQGSICIDAKHIVASLKAFPKSAEVLTLETSDKSTLIIRSGQSMFASPTIPAEDFPDMYESEGPVVTTLSESDLSTICEKVAYCASSCDYNSILGGINFKLHAGTGLDVVATDGSRMTWYSPVRAANKDSQADIQFTLPLQSTNRLALLSKHVGGKKYSPIGLIVDEVKAKDRVTFLSGRGRMTCRLISGSYPAYTELFPSYLGGYRILNKEGLLAACNAVLADKTERQNTLIICGLETGNLEGTFRSSLTGSSSNPQPISLNANYLKQWIQANDCDEVKLKLDDSKSRGPILLEGRQGDLKHLVMPIAATEKYSAQLSTWVPIEGWWSEFIKETQAV
jgi:DNA polymerase III beta subunit